MKKLKKLKISGNDVVSELLHKEDRNDIEESLFALWYDRVGYEIMAVKGMIMFSEIKEFLLELDSYLGDHDSVASNSFAHADLDNLLEKLK